MSKCWLLFLCLVCSTHLGSTDKNKRSLNEETVVWDPENSRENVGLFPVRERRASWGKWGKLGGVAALGLAPAIWDRWGRKKRSLNEDWDLENNDENMELVPVRERRASWGKWGKLGGVAALGLAPAIWDRWGRKKRSLNEDNLVWDPENSGDNMELVPIRERRASWGKWGKLGGVAALGLAPAIWDRWGRKKRSLNEESLVWDPETSGQNMELVPVRERRASWGKWGKLGGVAALGLAPSIWERWGGKKKRSLQDETGQWEPETTGDDVEDSLVRERRSWYKWAKIGAPIIGAFGSGIIDQFRGRRSLQDETGQWDPEINEENMGDYPSREKRSWYKAAKIGVPLLTSFAPSIYERFRGKRSMNQDNSLSKMNLQDEVLVSDTGFKCDDAFCVNKDGWFEYGVCSSQVCWCQGGKAKPQRCIQGMVFDPQSKECIDPRNLTICDF